MKKTIKKIFKIIGLGFLILVAVLALFIAARFGLAAVKAKQASRAVVSSIQNLGTTRNLTILPLFEKAVNSSDLQPGHGVSYLVITDNLTLLLDLGYNPNKESPSPLERNMSALGVSPENFSAVLISHPHPDHVGGLQWLFKQSFSLGNDQIPLDGRTIYAPSGMTYPGLKPVIVDQPQVIAPGVATLGVLHTTNVFPISLVTPSLVEQTLAVNVEGVGVVLISGCGHPGIENILARANHVLGIPVVGIVGGFHYTTQTAKQVQPHIAAVTALNPVIVALSPHDSGDIAIEAFRQAFPQVYRDIQVGTPIEITVQ